MSSYNNNLAYGQNAPSLSVFNAPIVAKRIPTSNDLNFQIGQLWLYPASNAPYILTSVVSNSATWELLSTSGSAGVFSSLTVNPGPSNLSTVGVGQVNIGNSSNTSAVTITSGSGGIALVGNGNTIAVGNDAHANTVNIGSTTGAAVTNINAGSGGIGLTGAVTSANAITVTAGDVNLTNGNLVLSSVGNKLKIPVGVNASIGTSTSLSSGSVTVNTSAVTAQSLIFLTRDVAGGTLGNLSVGTITSGMNFTITSDNNLDTSTVNYLIIN